MISLGISPSVRVSLVYQGWFAKFAKTEKIDDLGVPLISTPDGEIWPAGTLESGESQTKSVGTGDEEVSFECFRVSGATMDDVK